MSAKSSFECLSTEIICAILEELDGIGSLQSAILTCRRVHAAFSGGAPIIINRIILGQLDTWNVRPEALIALEASKLSTPTTAKSADEFCEHHLKKRTTDTRILLTLNEAGTIEKLLFTVEKLANTFAKDSLQKLASENGDASQSNAITSSEKGRIMRTLYRFEIFCNIFRLPGKESDSSRRKINRGHGQCMTKFLSYFSPWENEQLGCVYEFLFFQVSPVFNEVARHDIEWGQYAIDPVVCFDSDNIQPVLFRGLHTLANISAADTWSRKYELLNHESMFTSYLNNMYRSLKAASRLLPTDDPLVSSYKDVHDYTRTKMTFFQDPDNGPFEIWKWAYASTPVDRAYLNVPQAPLRKWGYMMWDKERLDALGISQHPWQPSPGAISLHDIPYFPGIFREDWTESWDKRWLIYKDGGRGWWNFGDESKIEWLRGKPKESDFISRLRMCSMSRADATRDHRQWSASLELK